MNIVLFCRILYVDFETLQHESLENRNTLSKDKDKCEDNLVYNNDVTSEEKSRGQQEQPERFKHVWRRFLRQRISKVK